MPLTTPVSRLRVRPEGNSGVTENSGFANDVVMGAVSTGASTTLEIVCDEGFAVGAGCAHGSDPMSPPRNGYPSL